MSVGFKVSGRIAKPAAEVFDAVVNPTKLSGYFTTLGGASAPLVAGTTVTWWGGKFRSRSTRSKPADASCCDGTAAAPT